MARVLFVLSIILTILTFTGAGYVLMNKGQVSPGYAVIPMLIGIGCLGCYRDMKKK